MAGPGGAQSRAAAVLRAYRACLRLAARVRPEAAAREAAAEIKREVRAHAGEEDGMRREELLRDLLVKEAFLKTVTPRRPGDAGERNVGKFVLRDGELVKVDAAEGKGVRAANGYPASLEEAKAMHHRLLKRQHYGREPPKPTTWDYMGF